MKTKMYVGQEVKCINNTGVERLNLGEKYFVQSVERTPEYQFITVGVMIDGTVYKSDRFEVTT